MRAIWSGAIGFGLVNIPVKLYSAVQASELDLDMLDKKDHSRIRFQRVNEESGKQVDWENIIRGYKYNKRYVILDEKDLASAAAEKNKVIGITQFVDQDEIDSIYYETAYYLEPDKSGARPYALLREALKKTGKVGVASFVLRTKQNLAILKPDEDVIILNKIRFAEEIRDYGDLHLPAASQAKPGELKMAIALIDQLSGKLDISSFKDEYSAQLMKIIKAKSRGVKVKPVKMKVAYSKSRDLMSQLKESLQKSKRKVS